MGDVAKLRWRSALPCAVRLRVKVLEAEWPQRRDSQVLGDQHGS